MIELSLDNVLLTINQYVDDALANVALHIQNRSHITMPSLISPQITSGGIDFYSFNTPASAIREIAIYSYLLNMMELALISVDKQTLLTVVKAMRKVPFVAYECLATYNKLASKYYEQEGNKRKADLHAISYLLADAKQYLTDFTEECEFDSDDEDSAQYDGEVQLEPADYLGILQKLNRNHLRYQALLLYILRYISTHLKERSCKFLRPQYTLIEQALSAAVNLYAQDENCDSELRSCIYYYDSLYYELTNRTQKATLSRKLYQEIGGEKDYEQLSDTLLHKLPELLRSEKDFIDYVMLFNTDYDENIDIDLYDEYGLHYELSMQGFYREQLMDIPFNHLYQKAEEGNPEAIREVVRCYREGDGVTACEAAAKAWESRL